MCTKEDKCIRKKFNWIISLDCWIKNLFLKKKNRVLFLYVFAKNYSNYKLIKYLKDNNFDCQKRNEFN